MGALRALQKLETEFLAELAGVYGVEEDEVPIELDLLQIYNSPEDTRLAQLVRWRDINSLFCGEFSLLITVTVSQYLTFS